MNRDFKVIAAIGLNTGIIGNNNTNDLPWSIRSDMQFFKAMTTGKTVVMGANTYRSMNSRNLPNRRNVVITSNAETLLGTPDQTYSSFKDALKFESPDLFVIGGKRLYEESLLYSPVSVYLTIVDDSVIRPNGLIDGDIDFAFTGAEVLTSPQQIGFNGFSFQVKSQTEWLHQDNNKFMFVELVGENNVQS